MRLFTRPLSLAVLFLGISLGLTGCYLPIVKKEVTLPFFEKKPDEAFKLMMDKTKDLPAFGFKASTTIDFSFQATNSDSGGLFSSVPISFKGKVFYNDDGGIDKSVASATKRMDNAKVVVDLGGMALRYDIETRQIGKDIFFKLNTLPTFFTMFMGNGMEGKWLGYNPETDKDIADGLVSFYGVDTDNNKEYQALIDEVKEYLKKNSAIKIKERLRDEKVGGRNSYHYAVGLEEKTVKDILAMVKKHSDKAEADRADSIGYGIFEEEDSVAKAEKQKQEDKVLAEMEKFILSFNGEVWIGKKNFELTKVLFVNNYEAKDFDAVFLTGSLSIKSKGEVEFSDAKNLKIEKPAEATSLKKFLEESNPYLSSSRSRARDASRVADVKMMQTAAELYFNDFGLYPDKLVLGGPLTGYSAKRSTTTYMSILPNNPTPNDGDCPADFEYDYQVKDNGQSYELKYCLGDSLDDIPAGINTATQAGISESEKDTDGDGLKDKDETAYGADPNKADTDGDGYDDGDEVDKGYNPNGSGAMTPEQEDAKFRSQIDF